MKKNSFYSVTTKGNKTILVTNTLLTYIVDLLGAIGLISCINNNLYIAIPVLVVVIVLMSIKYTTYWNLFKKLNLDKRKYVTIGSKFSFTNPLSYEIYRDKNDENK